MVLASSVSSGIRLTTFSTIAGRAQIISSVLRPSHARLFSVLRSRQFINAPSQKNNFPLFIGTRTFASSSRVASASPPSSNPVVPPSEAASASALPESTATAVSNNLSEIALSSSSVASDIVSSHIPNAIQYGDLGALGLTSWWPSGIINWSLEIINVTTGLPWFWTIVAGSVFWKVVTLPLAVTGLRSSARLQPIQPQLNAMNEKLTKARASGSRLEMQRQIVQMKALRETAGVKMGHLMLPTLQFPILIGMFLGVKGLCNSGLEQLKYSGFDLIPDLSVAAEPFYQLPLLLCVLANVQISVGASEMNTSERPGVGHAMNAFRLITVAAVFYMQTLPSGLLVSLIATSGLSILQSLAIKQPAFRRFCGIPIVPKEKQGKIPSPLVTIKEYIVNPLLSLKQSKRGSKKRKRQ